MLQKVCAFHLDNNTGICAGSRYFDRVDTKVKKGGRRGHGSKEGKGAGQLRRGSEHLLSEADIG